MGFDPFNQRGEKEGMIYLERTGHLHKLGLFYRPSDRQPCLIAYASTLENEKQNSYKTKWTHLKGRLCYIQYYDHLLFKNIKEKRDLEPIVRETIGWVQEVSLDPYPYVKIIWDRSVKMLPQEREDRISGMIILLPLVIEIREVNLE